MKFYHASTNKELEEIAPGDTIDIRAEQVIDESLKNQELCGVFGWETLEQAKNYGYECLASNFAVYEFELEGDEEIVNDPEYNEEDGARFVITENFYDAKKIFEE